MQMVYDVKQDRFLSIHDIELNIRETNDKNTYIDQNFEMNAHFQMICSSQPSFVPW